MKPLELYKSRLEQGTSSYDDIVLDVIADRHWADSTTLVQHLAVDLKVASTPKMYSVIYSLLDRGYLKHVPNLEDRRIRQVTLTDKGSSYLERITK